MCEVSKRVMKDSLLGAFGGASVRQALAPCRKQGQQ